MAIRSIRPHRTAAGPAARGRDAFVRAPFGVRPGDVRSAERQRDRSEDLRPSAPAALVQAVLATLLLLLPVLLH